MIKGPVVCLLTEKKMKVRHYPEDHWSNFVICKDGGSETRSDWSKVALTEEESKKLLNVLAIQFGYTLYIV